MRKSYSPGDTFKSPEGYEFLAVSDNGNGCDQCIGRLHTDICDSLPGGCSPDEIVWRPLNDAAKLMLVILKLEGKT